jgi:hypothetical protein
MALARPEMSGTRSSYAQQRQKVEPRFCWRGAEDGKIRAADLCGVIGHQAGMQHARVFGNKSIQSVGQQANHLPLGDVNTDIVQQDRQPLCRHLTLVVQHQTEPLEVQAEAAGCSRGQRSKHRLALRREPAFAAVVHELGPQDKVTHIVAAVSLEARSRRRADAKRLLPADPFHIAFRSARLLRSWFDAEPGIGRLRHASIES